MRTSTLLLILFCSAASHAAPPAPVPEALFGVKLGAVYQSGDGSDVGTFPVAAVTGMKPAILGQGSHIYFRPLKENERFPYFERKTESNSEYFDTSFRLYVYPVLSAEVLKAIKSANVDDIPMKWEVALIEWSDHAKDAFSAYIWAVETCKDFTLDLNRKPAVVDLPDANMYSCTFSARGRELKIYNRAETKNFELGISEKQTKVREAEVETAIRKLRMDKTRPY